MINNSVADYKSITVTCNNCDGVGYVYMTEDELRNYLNGKNLSLLCKKVLLERWHKENLVLCDECSGAGKWEKNV